MQDEDRKPGKFTIKSIKKAIPKRNQNKQTLALLGIIALAITIPIVLIAIIQPEGFFETRRSAAEKESYYGFIRNINILTDEQKAQFGFPIPEGYFLADENGLPLDANPSETLQKYIVFTDDLADFDEAEPKPDSIRQIDTNLISLESPFYLATIKEYTTIEQQDNITPAVKIESESGGAKAITGKEFPLNITITDENTGDLVSKFETTYCYTENEVLCFPLADWLKATDSIAAGEAFPISTNIIITPQAEDKNKRIVIKVKAADLQGAETEASFYLTVVEENVPPVINSISCDRESLTFQTGCTENKIERFEVSCTVNATDSNNDPLAYLFKNIPNEFRNVRTTGSQIKFTIAADYTPSGNYAFTVNVTDGINAPVEQTKIISVKTNEIPCPEKTPPAASFTAIPQSGSTPLTVKIDPQSSSDKDGNIILYKWAFGDGQEQEYNSPVAFEHTYENPGVYSITLETIDNDNLKDTETIAIRAGVNEPPQVIISKPNDGDYSGGQNNTENKISWLVTDAENDVPLKYELLLLSVRENQGCDFESTQFSEVYTLASGNLSFDNTNQIYFPLSFDWNTRSSLSGDVPDGAYCLKIVVSDENYGQSVTDYSDNLIRVENAEHPPFFTTESIPEATLNSPYSTQILASDEDGDDLLFNLTFGPSWLLLDSKGRMSGSPSESGPSVLIVSVTDGKSERSRSFTLNVKATEQQILPAITISPSSEVFVGDSGIINWVMTNDQDVSTLDLELSANGQDWEKIIEKLPKNQNEYNWNVKDLSPGKYLIRLVYFDENGNKLGASDIKELEIAKPEIKDESSPIVFNLKPSENLETTDDTPVISANFAPSKGEDVDINTISVYLDNEPLSGVEGYNAFEGGFAYIPKRNLNEGEHFIKAGFKDSAGKIVDKKWSFQITKAAIAAEPEEEAPSWQPDKYLLAGITILVVSVATAGAYFLWRRLNKTKILKNLFAPKITPPSKLPEEEKNLEQIFRGVRATVERETPKPE